MFGAYVRENRKVVIALAVYTAVFAFIFWLYRLPLGAVGYAALVCLFSLLAVLIHKRGMGNDEHIILGSQRSR